MSTPVIRPVDDVYGEDFFRLVRQLNPKMERPEFERRLRRILPTGYQVAGVYDADNTLIAASGYWVGARFYCGIMMHLDNFIVDAAHRKSGIGSALIDWL